MTKHSGITKKNIDFIVDIYANLNEQYSTKVDKIIKWHRKHGHPFYVEKSIKYLFGEKRYNRNRFTIVLPLSYFFSNSFADIDEAKWLEWSDIVEMPLEVEKKCIDYMALGRGNVDFIWGLDAERGAEKIYLEDEREQRIYGYVFRAKGREIVERYIYHKKSVLDKKNKFAFMYLRTKGGEKQIDSYHLALRQPLEVKGKGFIHLISYKKDESYTFYYRLE
jgi:hypothetical protein